MSKPPPAIMPLPMTPIDVLSSASTTSTTTSSSTSGTSIGSTPVGGLGPSSSSSSDLSGMATPQPPSPPELREPVIDNLPPPKYLSNPGAWDKADGEARRVLDVDCFDGAMFEFQKPLDQVGAFYSSHNIVMGSSLHQGGGLYQFGTTLVMGDSLLVGRVDNNLRLDAQWHMNYMNTALHRNLTHRLTGSISAPPDDSHFMAEFEYKGNDFTSAARIGDGFLLGTSYFQAVTPRIAMGGDIFYHTARRMTHLTSRVRYTDNNVTAVATGSTAKKTLSASFSRKVNNRVALASEIEFAPSTLDAHVAIGGEFVMRQSKFQASVTSMGIIQAVLHETVTPNCSLLLSAIIDHRKDLYKFGVGMRLG